MQTGFFIYINLMKYLVVGLGNIGQEYENTRHNVGFMVLDAIAEEYGLSFELGRHALKTEWRFKGRSFHLIKPTTYMNLSGKAVNYWLKELSIPKENCLVIVDEIALPFGSLRLRAKGSAAGHNGLKNIELELGGQNYPRLRFGIGDDFPKGRQVDYVLGQFSPSQSEDLASYIEKAKKIIQGFGTIGISRTMTEFND